MRNRFLVLLFSLALPILVRSTTFAGWIWVEGESPSSNKMKRHPGWYDKVKKEQFSGSDFISNFEKDKAGEAEYRFNAPEDAILPADFDCASDSACFVSSVAGGLSDLI